MKKKIFTLLTMAAVLSAFLVGCTSSATTWDKTGFDLTLPTDGQDGWYTTLSDDFDGDSLNTDIWTYSPHAVRWNSQSASKPNQTNYWCPAMVAVKNGNVEITSYETTSHVCPTGACPAVGRFSGGIETRRINSSDESQNQGTNDELLFSQAFGYFETKVKLPDANGLWSAFWLQSSMQRNILNDGIDGTEIDIFESAFRNIKPKQNAKNAEDNFKSKMGHALLWNGYGKSSKVDGYIGNLQQDLYDGFHTFALKWSPDSYVFYVDGQPTWASRGGGVAKVKEFLRLTVEMDAGDGWGPHGMKIGKFDAATKPVFYVDYVKVMQNTEYEKSIKNDSDFPYEIDFAN